MGHRFLSEKDKLIQSIDQSLQTIREAFSSPALEILSSLAEGSDRLVVQRAMLHPQATLIVPLPLPAEDYKSDFSDPSSVEEFRTQLKMAQSIIQLPKTNSRESAYQNSSQYILDNCDVLLVIWDGQKALGKGGTGEFALQARRRGIPLVWIHAGNRIPGTKQALTLGEKQGLVTFENFPDSG
jgi:hypothetical protein